MATPLLAAARRAGLCFSIASLLLLGPAAGSGSANASQAMAAFEPPTQPTLHLDRALAVRSDGPAFPTELAAQPVSLPDRWAGETPGVQDVVWYRLAFELAQPERPDDMLALYVEQACSNLQVMLNGHLIYGGGRTADATARHCAQPHSIAFPSTLLSAGGNVLDLRVAGQPVEEVGSVRRAGMLSPLELGTQSAVSIEHTGRSFWEAAWIRGSTLVLFALGGLMLAIGWLHRREVYFIYFGLLCLGSAAMSMALWSTELPWDNAATELMLVSGWPVLLAFAIQFLLSFAGLRSRLIELVVTLQCVGVPLSLLLAGADHRFESAQVWYVLLSAELLGVVGIYLVTAHKHRRSDFVPALLAGAAAAAVLLDELGVQLGLLEAGPVSLAECALPILLVFLGGRLFMMFARALRETVADRNRLAAQLLRTTAEMGARVEQLAVARVEQLIVQRVAEFTHQERRRIASDLHDDLGAKLLTIVHTRESTRIPQLAREALEEMRLSVRGLSGRPVLLEDALADWRTEVMNRLDQAGIKARWQRPEESLEQMLSARMFMQVTRILREAVSNVIKHAQARNCRVNFSVDDGWLSLKFRDDGQGIARDRRQGHGMSIMKRRAKKIGGQCLVESAADSGTVILLTVPL